MLSKETYPILWFGKAYSKTEFHTFLNEKVRRSLQDWELEILKFTKEWLDEKNEWFMVSTSGSTGKAKDISISRKQMIESALSTGEYLNLEKGQSALLILPAQFIAGKMMIVRALVLGLDFYYLEPKLGILKQLDRKYDFCAVIPLQIQKVLNTKQLELFSEVIIGGAAIGNEDITKLQGFDTRFYATYGMTETVTHIAIKPLNGTRISPFYHCLPGISIDRDDRECLRIFSQRLPQKITVTNDRVEMINASTFKLLGRVDAVINSGGLKIQAEEIEELIKEKLGLVSMLGYREDKALGQKMVLLVEGEEKELDKLNIQAQLEDILDKNKVPKEILFVKELFRTPNNKINRAKNQEWI